MEDRNTIDYFGQLSNHTIDYNLVVRHFFYIIIERHKYNRLLWSINQLFKKFRKILDKRYI